MWIVLPIGLAIAGAVPVLVMVRRVASEARALQRTLASLGELQEPLADLKLRVTSLQLPKRP